MTDRITELAEEAGIDVDGPFIRGSTEELQRFTELVRNETLEEAAKRCEQYVMEVSASSDATLYAHQYANAGAHCAEAIRGLKK